MTTRLSSSSDKRPVSRGCCLLAAVGLLALAVLPCLAVTLAMRGELVWQHGPMAEDRVWLVNEPDAAGLAYSAARAISIKTTTDGLLCVRTTITFFLWKGFGDNTQYCECYSRAPDGAYESAGACR